MKLRLFAKEEAPQARPHRCIQYWEDDRIEDVTYPHKYERREVVVKKCSVCGSEYRQQCGIFETPLWARELCERLYFLSHGRPLSVIRGCTGSMGVLEFPAFVAEMVEDLSEEERIGYVKALIDRARLTHDWGSVFDIWDKVTEEKETSEEGGSRCS